MSEIFDWPPLKQSHEQIPQWRCLFFPSLELALGDKHDICKNAIDMMLMADSNCSGTRNFSVGKTVKVADLIPILCKMNKLNNLHPRARKHRRLFSSEVSAHRLLP